MKIKFIIIILLSCLNLLAQDKVMSVQELDVVEDFIPMVPPSRKISDTPIIYDTIKIVKEVNYGTINKNYNTKYNIDTINPAKIKSEPITKLYPGYLKFKLGNVALPAFEGYYSSLRHKKWNYGVRYSYQNSRAKSEGFDSRFSKNIISAYGKAILDFGILTTNISRESNVFSAHGSDLLLTENQRRQYWSYSDINFSFENYYDVGEIKYSTKIKLSDLNEMTENHLSIHSEFEKEQGDYKYFLNLTGNVYKNNISKLNDFPLQKDQTIIVCKPSLYGAFYGLKMHIGFSQSSILIPGEKTQYNFYPYLKINHQIVPELLKIYGGVRGGVDQNTYSSLSRLNPFIVSALEYDAQRIDMNNTITPYDIYFGMHTYLLTSLDLRLESSFSKKNDMPFFILDKNTTYGNKFIVLYDDVYHLNLNTHLIWSPDKDKGIKLSSEYNYYKCFKFHHAYNMPDFKLSLSGFYNLGDKIITRLNIFSEFNRLTVYKDVTGSLSVDQDLGNMIDFDLSIEYKYNKVFSAFLEGNRLLGGYQIWQNYPVVSPQVYLGVSYQF